MNYYEDDFYDPSEFEMQVDEFKDSLRKSVKQEIQDEINKLRVENKSLKEIKANFDKIKNDYAKKERELENKKNDLQYQVRKERLSELFKDFRYYLYYPTKINQPLPKCDKCDEKGYIHFLSPSGNDCKEYCECRKGSPLYVSKEWYCSEFKLNYQNRNKILAWYSEHIEKDKDDYYVNTEVPKDIYDGTKSYEEIAEKSYYYTYFTTVEECQKYCDWLNEKYGYYKSDYVAPQKRQ